MLHWYQMDLNRRNSKVSQFNVEQIIRRNEKLNNFHNHKTGEATCMIQGASPKLRRLSALSKSCEKGQPF